MRASEAHAAFERLPMAGVHEVLGAASALVLAPHPDDESLGCGGLITACCEQARPPVVVIMTDGTGSHPHSAQYQPPRLRMLREHEAREATARLGLPPERLHFLGLPDGRAPRQGPSFDAAVARMISLLTDAGCGAIVAPWLHDPHCDHEAVQIMAREVARRTGLVLLSYPVWGWLLAADVTFAEPPIRGWRLDIAAHLTTKRHAIAAHVSQASDLIADDRTGFRLPEELLRVCDRPYEVFLRNA